MSSLNRVAVALLIAGLAAGPVQAAELAPAISSEIGWDSNNEGLSSDEDAQFRARTMPEISVRETLGRFAFNAKAIVAYDNALSTGLDDYFDQFADVGVVWSITSRTELSLSNAFARVENIDRATSIDSFATNEIPDTDDRRERTTRNRSMVTLTHRLTSRWTARATANYLFQDERADRRHDRTSYGGGASFFYTLNARATVNFGARYANDTYDQSEFQLGTRTRYYQGFLGLDYLLAPDLKVSMQGGPAWVDNKTRPGDLDFRAYPFVASFLGITPFDIDPTLNRSLPWGFLLDQSSCVSVGSVSAAFGCNAFLVPVQMTTANNPINRGLSRVAGEPDDSDGLDFFANASVVKSWEWGDVTLAYNRRETSSGGAGTASIADSIALHMTGFEPAPHWKTSALFSWTNRKSSGDTSPNVAAVNSTNLLVDQDGIIGGSNGPLTPLVGAAQSNGYVTAGSLSESVTDVTSYFTMLRVERRLSDKLNTYGFWSWRRDDREPKGFPNASVDEFRIFFGMRYDFDPVLF